MNTPHTKYSQSLYSQSLIPEAPERKESLFLPSFPLKSNTNSKPVKKCEKNLEIKLKPIMSPEQVKVLCDKIDQKKSSSIPPIKKRKFAREQLKIKNFKFKFRSTPPIASKNPPLKSFYISRLFQKREKDQVGENYKFMLTGANFMYLKTRILENDSSANSIVIDSNALDARYKPASQENKAKDLILNFNSYGDSDLIRRRTVFKSFNV